MAKTKKTNSFRRKLAALCAVSVAVLWIAMLQNQIVSAANLTVASLSVSDPRPSASNTTYTFTGSTVTQTTVKCIKLIYADSSTGTNVPTSLNTSGAGVAVDTVNTNYIPTPGSWTLNKTTNGTLLLTNASGETPAATSARKLVFNGITNGSVPDNHYFLRVTTFNNTDCATSQVDSVTTAFIYTGGSVLTLTVDPSLSFTVNAVGSGQSCNGATSTVTSTSTTIPFGTVNTASNAIACQDLQTASNASNGFTVYLRYTGKPTNSLGDQIADTSGSNISPAAFSGAGTEAYGYTTDDAALQALSVNRFISNKWAAATTTNSEVSYSPAGVNSMTSRVGHQVGVSSITRPGNYTTTVIYTCTPVF